jgi:hypothetical protein
MNEKEHDYLLQASEIFLSHGIKSLTMSDMASKLGIAKKTLYTFVTDKNDLVKKCIQLHITANECEMKEACTISNNAVEELINFSRIAGSKMKMIHPSIFFDLQKYHPEAWNLIRNFNDNAILELTKNNLLKGIEEGIYRQEMNIDVIGPVYVSIVQNIFNRTEEIQEGMSIVEYYSEIFNYHIRGIANEKGIKLINQYLN